MGKKKKKKKKSPTATLWSLSDESPERQARTAAYSRLMSVEKRLYQFWEQRNEGRMNWLGELLSLPVDEDMLWLAGLGDRVAALGGHLELTAVFPDETLTLLIEPGLDAGVDLPDDP